MKIVLIDDNGKALGLLAQELSRRAIDIDLTKIVAIWTEDTDIPADLTTLINESQKKVTTEIVGVITELELVSRLTQEFDAQESVVYVSDLNMEKIGLRSVREGSWCDETSELRTFLSTASENGHPIFLHSGSLNTDPIVRILTDGGVYVEKLYACFENAIEIAIEAEKVATEIVSRLGGTSIEKLWDGTHTQGTGESTSTLWFSAQGPPSATYPVPHNWIDEYASNETYKSAICSGLGISQVPAEIWTEAFHESLKGISGKYFVGSNGNESDKKTSILLGSVLIIVMMAYYNVHRNLTKVKSLFMLDKSVAMRPFTSVIDKFGHADKKISRAMGVALLFAFEACLKSESKHDNKCLTEIKHLEDGLQLIFDWSPIKLFNIARETIERLPISSSTSLRRRPAKSAEAVSDMVSILAYHPGRVLAGKYTINIQAVIRL